MTQPFNQMFTKILDIDIQTCIKTAGVRYF